MPVTISYGGSIGVIAASGRLDARAVADFERTARAGLRESTVLVIDLSEATDISPQVLRLLVMLDITMRHRRQRLYICPADSMVRRALEVAGVTLHATYAASVDAAMVSLAEPPSS
jgi:anti-anti-sigma regulatory factor